MPNNSYFAITKQQNTSTLSNMHDLKTNFDKMLDICKEIGKEFTNEQGNIPRCGVIPRFSDLEVIALSLTAESLSIDSENLLFHKLESDYKSDFPNLISRRQYNDRRKYLFGLSDRIRRAMVELIDASVNVFSVDSKPIEVCRISRSGRNKIGKRDYERAPSKGFCASQNRYYYGYKLHTVCGIKGVIHSFDLTKASVHDIHYLNDLKWEISDCTLLGDKGYINKEIQLDLFETARIQLEVPYRSNQKDFKPTFKLFKRFRKRIETLFSQLDDQFLMVRNYAKDVNGIFTRVLAKITAITALQYLNKINNRPIGRVKHALA